MLVTTTALVEDSSVKHDVGTATGEVIMVANVGLDTLASLPIGQCPRKGGRSDVHSLRSRTKKWCGYPRCY